MGLFHNYLKRAIILPTFKSKYKLDIKNYPSISVKYIICKVYEKLFYQRLL